MKHLGSASLLAISATFRTVVADVDWTTAYSKATTALGKLTNQEKIGIVTGTGWEKGPCVGNTSPVAKIGLPSLCLQDGPLGVRYAQNVSAFPAGIMAGSTWDVDLIRERGVAMGEEAKGLGIHVLLGPVSGPLGKNPRGGRNWEGFSNDPYLAGIAMAETIKGMQSAGVQANAKHYIGNEQEKFRGSATANIPDRVNHELYLWPFADAVKAGVASVMCSYNRVNGTYVCEHEGALEGVLKRELGFRGWVVSDWGAQHTTNGSAFAGLDMAMPGDGFGNNKYLWGESLATAVSSGEIPQSRLDDMVTRILASYYLVGQDKEYPSVQGWSSWNGGKGGPNVQGDHKKVARAIARDGIVLLKNEGNILPLKKPKSLAIVGSDAIVNPSGPNACVDRGCNIGTLAMGWGSGTAEFPYLVGPLDAIQAQAKLDNTTIVSSITDTPAEGATAAAAADTAIVFINSHAGEGYIVVEGSDGDRLTLSPAHNGNDLVRSVASSNPNTIVVIHSVGPLILEPILSFPSVKAIVWAGLPGQESGNGLADILYGKTSPSGKLPYTIARRDEDYGGDVKGGNGDDEYSEGLYVDYRYFDKRGIKPRFEFGFGLSYTTFTYSGLEITPSTLSPSIGLSSDLYDTIVTVTTAVTNNGTVAGAEAAQFYVSLPSSAPESPVRQLRGFKKVMLGVGESKTVKFDLRRKDLSYWDVVAQQWVMAKGEYTVWVGASSRDLRVSGVLRG
ncbi:putative beta-glucosidase L [Amylocarpus encephaloides]|uniref:beta-glucosidase n=1 Tax=Amylocarpus encephaloides TaxID=45428 RepID=A0A9P7YIG3_9HELO|nr:putative beta-glucosidase L [Amylocarpus encephaloides]